MPPPEQLTTVYATDESIAVRAAGDFVTLCPIWQTLASGTDGVIASGSPWVLTSATVDFETSGVSANHVVQLVKTGTYRGSGDLLAVESVSGSSLTLRRIYQAASAGQPPTASTGVGFVIATLDPQIEEASFALNRRFGIDPAISLKAPTSLYDMRDLREATVLTVLRDRYVAEARGKDGDFWGKVQQLNNTLEEVLGRLQVRWTAPGASGFQIETSSLSSSARVTR
ncbi:MAG: hypothetical protein KGL39_52560 [Patescibacteria group bacterium]|nr:hypothetical protein [Patescibacteria group bacterium]